MSERDPLPGDLNRLRRKNRWTPLTPDEADAELAAAPDKPLGEDLIDALVRSANLGDVRPALPQSPDWWMEEEEITESDRHALLLNRAPDEGDAGPAEKPQEPSERDALDDEEDDAPDAKSREPSN